MGRTSKSKTKRTYNNVVRRSRTGETRSYVNADAAPLARRGFRVAHPTASPSECDPSLVPLRATNLIQYEIPATVAEYKDALIALIRGAEMWADDDEQSPDAVKFWSEVASDLDSIRDRVVDTY